MSLRGTYSGGLMPSSCSKVAVVDVDPHELVGRRLFHATRYVVARRGHGPLAEGEEVAVVRVEVEGSGPLRRVARVEEVGRGCRVVVDRDLDVHDPLQLLGRAIEALDGRPGVAVIEGQGGNVSFVKLSRPIRAPLRLKLVDVVPPRPSRMGYLRPRLNVPGPIDVEVVEVDVSRRGPVYAPCPIEGVPTFKRGGPIEEGARLMACRSSMRWAEWRGEVADVCPLSYVDEVEGADAIVARCCMFEAPRLVRFRGATPIVATSWPCTLAELSDAAFKALRLALGVVVD